MAKPDRKPPKKSTRSLRGKGPTPKAEDRPYHKKYKSKEESKRKRTERKRIDSKRGAKGDRKFSQRRDFRRNEREHVDTVAGRNAVLEALRAGIPAKELILAIGVDIDERLNESIRLAQKMAIGIKEVERRAIENMTGIANIKALHSLSSHFNIHLRKKFLQELKILPSLSLLME